MNNNNNKNSNTGMIIFALAVAAIVGFMMFRSPYVQSIIEKNTPINLPDVVEPALQTGNPTGVYYVSVVVQNDKGFIAMGVDRGSSESRMFWVGGTFAENKCYRLDESIMVDGYPSSAEVLCPR